MRPPPLTLSGLKAALLVASVMSGLFWAPPAQAACPGIFNGLTCNGGSGPNNCLLVGSAITCDV